jgi:hypothetical protein
MTGYGQKRADIGPLFFWMVEPAAANEFPEHCIAAINYDGDQ